MKQTDKSNVRMMKKSFFSKSFFILPFRLLSNGDNFDPAFDLEYRGLVTMKGKAEPMKCWFLNRAKDDYVNVPHAEDLLR